jgi:hypothetical protein
MSAVTSFKVAFLSRCAEEGLTLEQIHERVKTAVARAEAKYGETEKEALSAKDIAKVGLIGTVLSAGGKAVEKAWPSLTSAGTAWLGGATPQQSALAGVLGPSNSDKGIVWPIAGLGLAALAGGGLAAGRYMATAQEDPLAEEEIKNRELINEYKRLADRTRAASKRRQLLEGKGGI